MRTRLPTVRNGKTHRAKIAGNALYFTVNVSAAGLPREIINVKYCIDSDDSIDITTVREVEFHLNMWSIAISMALQHGAELKDVCRKFMHQQAGCGGLTDNENIRNCKSLEDYIVKWIWSEFGDGDKL